MDKKQFENIAARLTEIGNVLIKLPAEVRAEAFGMLKSYALLDSSPSGGRKVVTDAGNASDSRDAFFSAHDADKPADAVKLLAAYHFSEYGSATFKTEDLEELAGSVGLTIPSRVDMTLEAAVTEGKKLFTRAGRGQFRPTVHGEAYFRKTYKVEKGKKTKPESGE